MKFIVSEAVPELLFDMRRYRKMNAKEMGSKYYDAHLLLFHLAAEPQG